MCIYICVCVWGGGGCLDKYINSGSVLEPYTFPYKVFAYIYIDEKNKFGHTYYEHQGQRTCYV